jgi:hypothetical protein
MDVAMGLPVHDADRRDIAFGINRRYYTSELDVDLELRKEFGSVSERNCGSVSAE